MKILVLTSVYKDFSMAERDTSTNIVNSFVYDWKKSGHDVIVIHNAHCYPKFVHCIPVSIKKKLSTKMSFSIADYEAVKEKKYIDNEITIYRTPIRKWIPHRAPSDRTISLQLRRIINILEQENFVPDVITGHWASPQLELISALKKKYDCKTACVLHGLGYINNSDFNANKYIAGIDHLGCRSLTQAYNTKNLLGLEKQPFVCYSGVPDSYLENYELLTEKFDDIEEIRVTYVGRLVAYKNIDATIKALASLKSTNWVFNIVGEGAERIRLEELAKSLGCDDKVRFLGRVPRERVMEILKETHIFVMISTNEIFGLVYLEAMAASCLTVASKNGGVDGIIIDGENGFLCTEGDSEDLAQIITNRILANDRDSLKRIVSNGYKTVKDFSDSNMARVYLENITN